MIIMAVINDGLFTPLDFIVEDFPYLREQFVGHIENSITLIMFTQIFDRDAPTSTNFRWRSSFTQSRLS